MNASMSATCQRAMTARDCPLGHDWVGGTAYVQPYSQPHTQESPMRYENLGPVTNPDGSPTDLTRSMLAGTGRDPVAFAAGDEAPSFEEVVANPAAVSNGIRYQATLNGLALILTEVRALRAVVTRAQPTPIRRMTGDEAANAGFVPGVDFVTCDICEEVEFFTEGVPDWNGETGAHLSCEER